MEVAAKKIERVKGLRPQGAPPQGNSEFTEEEGVVLDQALVLAKDRIKTRFVKSQ